MADEKKKDTQKEPKKPEKPEEGHTLARFFGDEKDMDTQVIDQAKQYAHRRLGKAQGRPVINALERLEKKRKDAKEAKEKDKEKK